MGANQLVVLNVYDMVSEYGPRGPSPAQAGILSPVGSDPAPRVSCLASPPPA